jgi:prepilin-type N-terminal cleavage/methylation domain-containing protein/prepilin-type processing-associated H-X9-DG protein
MKKSAFTLIELLVVITIIAILAGIMLPVFGGVQEKARATQDASNLKQLGIGATAYYNDHDDTVFSGTTFATALHPQYIGIWKSFQSPFDQRTPSELDASAPVSYNLNVSLSGTNCSDIVSPSSCIMIAPQLTTYYPNITFAGVPTTPANLTKSSNSTGTAGGTHNKGKRINVLFADAHCEPLLMSDFHSTTPLQNTDPATKDRVNDLRWNK